jgi:gamma-glutamyltranspeptidase/glutathione hydrolase
MLRGASPQAAIDAPRLNALPDLVRLEPGFDPAVLRGLEDAGMPTAVAAALDPYFGGVSALSPLGAGADPRRSGSVLLR